MFPAFIDKALSLLDRRFLVGYWMPALLFGLTLFFTADWSLPWLGYTPEDLFALEGPHLVGITLGLFLLVTLFAYLLHAFTWVIIRFYEGYWPWRWVQDWRIHRQAERWQALDKQCHEAVERWQALNKQGREKTAEAEDLLRRYAVLQAQLYRDFPSNKERILPTRLGNVMRAAEDYSLTRYGLDGVFWWPRLEPLLPPPLSDRLEAAFTVLVMLLNLATLALFFAFLLVMNAVIGSVSTLLQDWGVAGSFSWRVSSSTVFSWLLGAFLSLIAFYVAYRGAVVQARAYGDLIRVAYDEHRFRILDALHIARPNTLVEEHALWGRLTRWLYQQDLGAARDLTYVPPAEEE